MLLTYVFVYLSESNPAQNFINVNVNSESFRFPGAESGLTENGKINQIMKAHEERVLWGPLGIKTRRALSGPRFPAD